MKYSRAPWLCVCWADGGFVHQIRIVLTLVRINMRSLNLAGFEMIYLAAHTFTPPTQSILRCLYNQRRRDNMFVFCFFLFSFTKVENDLILRYCFSSNVEGKVLQSQRQTREQRRLQQDMDHRSQKPKYIFPLHCSTWRHYLNTRQAHIDVRKPQKWITSTNIIQKIK